MIYLTEDRPDSTTYRVSAFNTSATLLWTDSYTLPSSGFVVKSREVRGGLVYITLLEYAVGAYILVLKIDISAQSISSYKADDDGVIWAQPGLWSLSWSPDMNYFNVGGQNSVHSLLTDTVILISRDVVSYRRQIMADGWVGDLRVGNNDDAVSDENDVQDFSYENYQTDVTYPHLFPLSGAQHSSWGIVIGDYGGDYLIAWDVDAVQLNIDPAWTIAGEGPDYAVDSDGFVVFDVSIDPGPGETRTWFFERWDYSSGVWSKRYSTTHLLESYQTSYYASCKSGFILCYYSDSGTYDLLILDNDGVEIYRDTPTQTEQYYQVIAAIDFYDVNDTRIGTDDNTYVCKSAHSPSEDTVPITGDDWADYWALGAGADGDSLMVRMIPFIYSSSIAYVCEFGDKYIRFYYDGTLLET